MRRPRTLAITEKYEKVEKFLKSKSINSEQTKNAYGFALSHFQTFLDSEYNKDYDLETILIPLEQKKINVYDLLENFVGYLTLRQDASNSNTKLSPNSRWLYVAGVRSYLEKYDIDTHKFQRKVTMPKKYKRIKEAINAEDIRTILLSCTNPRLKVFLLVLASTGMRAIEALSLKNSDIDFSPIPTKVHIRPEISKTNQANDIYISDEATKELKKFIDSKYSLVDEFKKYPEHLVFSKRYDKVSIKPISIYRKLLEHFHKVLDKVEMAKRKEGQGIQRREITFHLFRTFVKTTISTQINSDFSEWFLSHSGSTYWSMKELDRRELYIKCMKYLTFLDYPTVETVGRNFESQLEQKTKEIDELKQARKRTEEQLLKMEQELKEEKRLFLKAMAGHVVMESDLKTGFSQAWNRRQKQQKKKGKK